MTADEESEWRRLANDVREGLAETENTLYYLASLVRRYRTWQLWVKVAVAGASCVPFVAKLAATSPAASSWYVAVVPLVAVGLPLWGPDKLVEAISKSHGEHAGLLAALQSLWRRARARPHGDVAKTLAELGAALDEVDALRTAARANITSVPEHAGLREKSRIKSARDYPMAGERVDRPRLPSPSEPVLYMRR